ncbi:hypothetical protein B0G84_5550 [Paraburkholderia sp. BL8N3]|jgi:hypothetical protein|nr:hypothetical protein B0G84_5550 [Paraburkholderia sp. BL8N3]
MKDEHASRLKPEANGVMKTAQRRLGASDRMRASIRARRLPVRLLQRAACKPLAEAIVV